MGGGDKARRQMYEEAAGKDPRRTSELLRKHIHEMMK